MTTNTIPATKNLSTLALAEALSAKDNKYQLLYFPFHGAVTCLRAMFSMSNLDFESVYSTVNYVDDVIAKKGFESMFPNRSEWTADKPLAPFGHLPILYIETKSKEIIELAELSTIEFFIAEKMNLLGDNEMEKQLVSMYRSNTQALFDKLVTTVLRAPKEHAAQMMEIFITTILPEWASYHERILQANGANGHYVGNNLTLADFKTGTMIDNLVSISGELVISREKTPAIFAVYDNLEKNPKYAKWKASEEWKAYDSISKALAPF
ncbi:hypothetical protein BGW38_007580 [Lunasporangiospora selenospora]|uniref:Glutathione S-transferase n=1 Tax=Lunasporangiospora selenospora TaxID=979761 RepID=A0A9P6FZ43_9FUNG|nr:hypothetical protein BGW38_007580 [Lunasporangiospora selenospora]